MAGSDDRHEGRCRCGRVRFRVEGEPIVTMACHCEGCQRMTASAFSLSDLYPSDRFAVLQGEPVIGGLHGATRHFFCPDCMSWLFTRPEGMDEFVNVRTTMLEDPGRFPPFIETHTREKLPWATTPALHSFEALPPMERYPELMAEFAARNDPRPGRGAPSPS
ncbi:GFA family protein [Microvirga sp. HBU67558]|uniref:GFA family protein n=1 Tax=Microvirga TaxID=186650 RepID=UPI001B38849E|nr:MULTISPECIES: GFA family protein [unclassified Microvirga]MBQ0822985.1 GFA family protein [Microvirga sp. HBU67558]